jgi:hypothetical protein
MGRIPRCHPPQLHAVIMAIGTDKPGTPPRVPRCESSLGPVIHQAVVPDAGQYGRGQAGQPGALPGEVGLVGARDEGTGPVSGPATKTPWPCRQIRSTQASGRTSLGGAPPAGTTLTHRQ